MKVAKQIHCRRGIATLDYILVMGIILPMAAFTLWASPWILQRVYEMFCLFIAAPWM